MRHLLDTLPRPKRQPHLVFAVSRLLGAPEAGYTQWRTWVLAHWPELFAEASRRGTQTNEPLRCAALLPILAGIAGPIALLEVGSSAGLCLYPDRYSYEYVADDAGNELPPLRRLDPATGPSPVLLRCSTTGGVPVPESMPNIVWRSGIDLSPLSVMDDADVRWLDMSVGPEQSDRRARIRAAVDIVRSDPPRQYAGDASDLLARVAASAPPDATLVVLSAGVLVYMAAADRDRFAAAVASLGARWISFEGPAVLPAVAARLVGAAPAEGMFPVALDQHPLAWSAPHGQALHWLAPAQ